MVLFFVAVINPYSLLELIICDSSSFFTFDSTLCISIYGYAWLQYDRAIELYMARPQFFYRALLLAV